jgi:hypothetical protein
MTKYTLERTVWFSTLNNTDTLAHIVARDLIKRGTKGDRRGYENLLQLIRRYE